MSIVVNTNIGSLNAQRSLAESSRELSTAMERLSSGKKKSTLQLMMQPDLLLPSG